MLSTPVIAYRGKQSLAVIQAWVAMNDIPRVLPPLIPEVNAWLDSNGIEKAGPPFFEYLRFDSDRRLLSQVGFPVNSPVKPGGRIIAAAFPAGYYASVIYTGDYMQLRNAHMSLDAWIKEQGLAAGIYHSVDGEKNGCRIESYLTDPQQEPLPGKWQTQLLVLLDNASIKK